MQPQFFVPEHPAWGLMARPAVLANVAGGLGGRRCVLFNALIQLTNVDLGAGCSTCLRPIQCVIVVKSRAAGSNGVCAASNSAPRCGQKGSSAKGGHMRHCPRTVVLARDLLCRRQFLPRRRACCAAGSACCSVAGRCAEHELVELSLRIQPFAM